MKDNYIIWFTGISSAGKSTLSQILYNHINTPTVLLDGDIVRKYISSDLVYTKGDRLKQMDRLYGISRMLYENKINSIISTNTSPSKYIDNIFIIYVKCSLEECKKRDVKHLFKKYNEGTIKNVMGIDLEYIPPDDPFLTLKTDEYTIDECITKLIKKLKEEKII